MKRAGISALFRYAAEGRSPHPMWLECSRWHGAGVPKWHDYPPSAWFSGFWEWNAETKNLQHDPLFCLPWRAWNIGIISLRTESFLLVCPHDSLLFGELQAWKDVRQWWQSRSVLITSKCSTCSVEKPNYFFSFSREDWYGHSSHHFPYLDKDVQTADWFLQSHSTELMVRNSDSNCLKASGMNGNGVNLGLYWGF